METEPELFPKQLKLLTFLRDYHRENQYPPSTREMMGCLGVSSSNAVGEIVAKLEHRGLIQRTPGRQRSVVLTGRGKHLLSRGGRSGERPALRRGA